MESLTKLLRALRGSRDKNDDLKQDKNDRGWEGYANLLELHPDALSAGDRVATPEGNVFQVESVVAQGERILRCELNPVKDADKDGWGGTVNQDRAATLALTPDNPVLFTRKLEKRD